MFQGLLQAGLSAELKDSCNSEEATEDYSIIFDGVFPNLLVIFTVL